LFARKYPRQYQYIGPHSRIATGAGKIEENKRSSKPTPEKMGCTTLHLRDDGVELADLQQIGPKKQALKRQTR
jgi:hypothetical protein